MKHLTSVILILLLMSLSLLGTDFDYTIYDQYRIDTLRYAYPQLRLDYERYGHHQDRQNWQGDSIDYELNERNSNLHLTGRYYRYFQSEARVHSLVLYSSLRHDNRDQEIHSDQEQSSDRDLDNFSYDFKVSEYRYLGGGNNWHVGLDARLVVSRNRNNLVSELNQSGYEQFNHDDRLQGYQDHYLALKFGTGRIRNVTGLHRVLLMLERLEEMGVALPELAPDDVVRLAQALDTKGKYSKLYFRSGKVYWAHVAQVFQDLGASIDDLGLYESLNFTEAASLLHFERYVGASWWIGTRLQYHKDINQRKRYDQADSLLSDSDDWQETSYILINPTYQWDRPLSLKAALRLKAEILAGPALNSDAIYNQQYSLLLSSSYQYDITDRMMSSLVGEYSFNRWNYNKAADSWNREYDLLRHQATAIASFKYYLIDQASIDLSYRYEFGADLFKDIDLPPDEKWSNGVFSITVTYGPRSPSIH